MACVWPHHWPVGPLLHHVRLLALNRYCAHFCTCCHTRGSSMFPAFTSTSTHSSHCPCVLVFLAFTSVFTCSLYLHLHSCVPCIHICIHMFLVFASAFMCSSRLHSPLHVPCVRICVHTWFHVHDCPLTCLFRYVVNN